MVEDRIDALGKSLLRIVALNQEMQNQENFDKGQYQGMLGLVHAIEEVRTLIKEKETR